MTDFGDALREMLAARDVLDPTGSVSVYDLHYEGGAHSGYALVRVEWLDHVWQASGHGNEMLPHEHLGDVT